MSGRASLAGPFPAGSLYRLLGRLLEAAEAGGRTGTAIEISEKRVASVPYLSIRSRAKAGGSPGAMRGQTSRRNSQADIASHLTPATEGQEPLKRVAGKAHRDHHPLAHAAGELVGVVANPVRRRGNTHHF